MVRETYFKPDENSPVFLFIGGEGGALGPELLVNSTHASVMVDTAKEQNALLLFLEHRYYGDSYPTEDLSNENLRYLSANQALSDLAEFHLFVSEKYNLTKQNKWITWSSSYPGMLSGWARIKFPHLIHAAVANSAPVRAQVDFKGYLKVVKDALANEIIGGSEQCQQIIVDGHDEIR